MATRICSNCGLKKEETEFRKDKHKKQCKQCLSFKSLEYNKNHKSERKEYSKLWQRTDKRKKYITEYYQSNKDSLKVLQKERENKKYATDPAFRLRRIISASISRALKNNGSSKNNRSVNKYLPYSLTELKKYLEKQFEPWMTWDNQGVYDAKIWIDNDSSTWVWNIDHIIPHSTFDYTSMKDRSFIDCWALSNLRPYSAKQNVIDGLNRIRHIERTTENVK